MDTVPRLFTEAVQILLMKQTNCSGRWARSAFFDRRFKNPAKRVDLHLIENGSAIEYQIKCLESSSVLSLEHTLLKSYELNTIRVYRSILPSAQQLDSRAYLTLRGFISRTESEVKMIIYSFNNNSDVKSLLEAVPRYEAIYFLLSDRKHFLEPMQSMKVKSIAFGEIHMTHYMFSQISAFTENPNFRSLQFTMVKDSEISTRTVFDFLLKRLGKLQSQGKKSYLRHGNCRHNRNRKASNFPSNCKQKELTSNEMYLLVL
ncbi:hypothetical protein L596_029856 [Steinernema carpocapsae]|uniref:Uncharacterized protein n=1 Tax=Steinernema carpocapsae TaxID=34508 RepID=A0A4U5LR11_STECR|nr:hypothetical protein L596_029856 [Steinernema carpocapsae]